MSKFGLGRGLADLKAEIGRIHSGKGCFATDFIAGRHGSRI